MLGIKKEREILKRLNEINEEYNIAFYEITCEEEISEFYTLSIEKYNENMLPGEIFNEIQTIWESI